MEKTLYNQVGEVKGKESSEQDSFSFQFIPQNENLKRTRGALFTLVSVKGKLEDKYEKAKAFYHAFQSSYYAKASGSIINGLSETLEHLDKEIIKKEAESGVELSLVAAVFWGSVVYLAKNGRDGVFVARSGKLKKLDFNKVASGVLEDQDLVCLTSENFANNILVEDLGELLNKDKFEKILEGIDDQIKDKEASICVVIRLSVNAPEEKPEELAIGEVAESGKAEFAKDENDLASKEKMPEEKGEENSTVDEEVLPKEKPETRLAAASAILRKVSSQGQALVMRLGNKILKPWKKAVPGELVDHVAVRRARLLQIAAVVIILLVGSIIIGANSKAKPRGNDQAKAYVTAAQKDLTEAKSIVTIDPVRAKVLLGSATNNVQKAEKLGSKDSQLKTIADQVATLSAEITRSYKIDKLEEIYDFSKLNSNPNINKAALFNDQIVFTDSKNNSVYSVVLDSKQGSKLDGTFNNPETIAAFTNGFYVQTKDNLVKVDAAGNSATAASNSGWGTIAGAATYQSNLYLLDKGKNEIWRYVSASAGLSSGKAYLSGEKPDLTSGVAIAIDDLVWVATKNGTIYKFAQGKKQDFAITNLSDNFGQVVDLFTSSATKNHYILDQGKARIVIVDKTGIYQSQYTNDKLHQATSLIVKEDTKTVYFTSNGKLYSFKIR